MKAFVETKNMSPTEKETLGNLLQHPTPGTTLVYSNAGWITMEVDDNTLATLTAEKEKQFRKNSDPEWQTKKDQWVQEGKSHA